MQGEARIVWAFAHRFDNTGIVVGGQKRSIGSISGFRACRAHEQRCQAGACPVGADCAAAGIDTSPRRPSIGCMPFAPSVDRRTPVMAAALVAPPVVCAILVPFRGPHNVSPALVLVLVIVAVASSGVRLAGVVAALSSTFAFDFFLTQPYYSFSVTSRVDVETAGALLLVGVAVTELALWGRRQQAQASRQSGYLQGILRASASSAIGDADTDVLIEHICEQITDVLEVDACSFDESSEPGLPVLESDGSVTRNGHDLHVDEHGLPTDSEIELPARSGGKVSGRFLLTASTRIARPTLDQRLVALALAQQVATVVAARRGLP